MHNIQKVTRDSIECKSATDTLKATSKRVIQKTTEATCNLSGNKTTKMRKYLPETDSQIEEKSIEIPPPQKKKKKMVEVR